ncbi:MAG TPA: O-antigen ligase family protein [Vicinamibacterales bacterium]|nr:O-antigen ligase family protein [Vicinamibacterales bacterium]
MSAFARTGWVVCAAFFAVLLSSIVHVEFAGLVPVLVLFAIAALVAIRPGYAIAVIGGLTPIAWYLASMRWNAGVDWAEALACAVITGLAIHAARGSAYSRMPRAIAAPLWLFVTVVATSIVACLGVVAMRLGPVFGDALIMHVTRAHFIDLSGFPALHAGVLLIEGTLLCALVARLPPRDNALRRAVMAVTVGASVAAILNMVRLVGAAARAADFWTSLVALSVRLRWNVHYADVNAAGSYFAMTALASAGLWIGGTRGDRVVWGAATALSTIALWLTGSRVAELALVLTTAATIIGARAATRRLRVVTVAGISAAAALLLILIAVVLPHRGNQQSSRLAADVRLGMARTAVKMLEVRPVFGVGLGAFYQRSGEFSSPDLIAKFPVAVHENAHNNFLQVAAELGLVGGVLFAWLVTAGVFAIARFAWRTEERLAVMAAAGLAAFVLTWLGNHPLLIPEPAYVFWMLLGAGVSTAAATETPPPPRRWLVPAACVALALTLPWQMRGMVMDAELEHVGIGLSRDWQVSPDGIRYRDAPGQASIFVPSASAFRFSVNLRSGIPARLELTLDGRVADVVSLAPERWNDVTLPSRATRPEARYRRLDLRLLDADRSVIWITKVQPLEPAR